MTAEAIELAWDSLAKDMKVVVDFVYSPLNIKCSGDPEFSYLDYYPPFNISNGQHPNDNSIKITCDDNIVPSYPLVCRLSTSRTKFTVRSKDDWINHVDEFIPDKDDIIDLINSIRQ
jgi:hypothetical protein